MEAFNKYRGELLEYHINNKEMFSKNDTIITEFIEKGLNEEEITTIMNKAIRYDANAAYKGKIINIYHLTEHLKADIQESQSYISVQERHLFEDILLKTVGNKIRDSIESSKQWVAKINEIMQTTQMGSNLSYQLEWKSKQSFTEDELDTKELIRLFKMDPGSTKDSESEKIITHFRSKIKKELEYEEYTNESYASIIARVLDYRTWFEFKLYYKRKAGEKKVTRKSFSKIY